MQHKVHNEPIQNSCLECDRISQGALILALPTQLQRIDKMQRWFLDELDMTDTEAFVVYNFAPPSIRRRIGILGFLHKRVLEVCHPAMVKDLKLESVQAGRYHTRTLESHWSEVNSHSRLFNNSYTCIYSCTADCRKRLWIVLRFLVFKRS